MRQFFRIFTTAISHDSRHTVVFGAAEITLKLFWNRGKIDLISQRREIVLFSTTRNSIHHCNNRLELWFVIYFVNENGFQCHHLNLNKGKPAGWSRL